MIGTYHNAKNTFLKKPEGQTCKLYKVDLNNHGDLKKFIENLNIEKPSWDELLIMPGTLLPIGLFSESDFTDWKDSFEVNFFGPMYIIRNLLRWRKKMASVITFSGSGTNGTADHLSGYTCGKIALIKAMELLDSEIEDVKFSCIGPGWVKTKIHSEMLRSNKNAAKKFEETKVRIQNNDFVKMEEVVECINWIIEQQKSIVGGRNLSVPFDLWKTESFPTILDQNPNNGKLRRYGNDELNGKMNE